MTLFKKATKHEAPVFIYALSDPRTFEVRYIGKTEDLQRRYKDHVNCFSKPRTHKNNWIRELVSANLLPIMDVIAATSRESANERECELIAIAKNSGFSLTNKTDGGDGVVGLHHSDDARRRMSEKAKGRVISPETRAKIGTASRRLFTLERRQQYSDMFKNREFSLETRKKISESRKGMKFSASHVANISRAKRGTPAHNKGKPLPEWQRQAVSRAQRGLSDEDAMRVLELIDEGTLTQTQIALRFDVSGALITTIKQGKSCYKKVREQWENRCSLKL